MQPFKMAGKWWLPESPERQVLGTLSCSESGELELELFGTLSGGLFNARWEFPIILGVADNESRSAEVTLLACFGTRRSSGSSGDKETFLANRGYFGFHPSNSDHILFSEADFKLSGLGSWAEGVTGFNKTSPMQCNIAWTQPQLVKREMPGGTLSLGVGCEVISGHRDRRITERLGFALDFETALTGQQIESGYLTPLQNLLTFATDHPNCVTDLILTPANSSGGVKVIAPLTFWDESVASDLTEWYMLFTFADVRDRFPELCRCWLELSKLQRAAFSLYFGSRYRPPSYTDLRVSLLAQVLSLYFAVRPATVPRAVSGSGLPTDFQTLLDTHPVVTTERALTAFTAEFEDHFTLLLEDRVKRIGSFTEYATNTVRYTLTRTPPDGPYAGDGSALYWLGERLAFLFKMAVLSDLGFNHQDISRLMERNRTYRHIRDSVQSKRRL